MINTDFYRKLSKDGKLPEALNDMTEAGREEAYKVLEKHEQTITKIVDGAKEEIVDGVSALITLFGDNEMSRAIVQECIIDAVISCKAESE
jgi:hypothetical protein